MRILLALLLTACSCWGQAFTLRDPAFVGQQYAAGVACHNTCTADKFCDKFENTLDNSYLTNGVGWRGVFVTQARGSCSSHFLSWTNGLIGDFLTWTNSADYSTNYTEMWFRVGKDSLSDNSSNRLCEVKSSANSDIAWVNVQKYSGQLQLIGVCVNSGFAVTPGTPTNITAGVWYHIGIYAKVSGTALFYFCNTQTFGSAMDAPVNLTSRNPRQVQFGFVAGGGTWGQSSTGFDFDSLTTDTQGFKPIEY